MTQIEAIHEGNGNHDHVDFLDTKTNVIAKFHIMKNSDLNSNHLGKTGINISAHWEIIPSVRRIQDQDPWIIQTELWPQLAKLMLPSSK
ncbi:hypothetical protein [Cupriavidus sp. PET2-C1]